MNVKTFLFFLAFVVVGIWFIAGDISNPIVKKSVPNQKKTSSALYNYNKEIQTHYRLKFNQDSSLISSDLLPGKFTYSFIVNAILNMRVLEKEDEFYWLAYQFSEFELTGAGVTKDMVKRLEPYYSSIFLLKVNVSGKIMEIHFGGVEINFAGLKQLMYLLEVINLDKNNYKLQQKDAIGLYQSFYRKNTRTIEKQKTKYINVKTPDERYKVEVQKFSLLAEVDVKGNWLKSLMLSEKLLIRDEKRIPYAKNQNIIKLQKSDEPIDNTLTIWQEKRSIKEILKSFKELKQMDENIFEVLERENTKKQFLSSKTTVKSLIKELNSNPKNSAIYRKIAKYIEVFPDTTPELKSRIIDASDSMAMHMLSMLSSVSTEQAQELLADIANSDETSHMNNIRAIIGLSGVEIATAKTLNTLMELSDKRGVENRNDKSNTALLALGAHTKDKELQNEDIISYIHAEYASDISLDREKNILYAMQNAGAENFIEEIEKSLNSSSTKVRTVAIKTIGTIEDDALRKSLLQKQQIEQEDVKVKALILELLKR